MVVWPAKSPTLLWSCNSEVECSLDRRNVAGSIPALTTIYTGNAVKRKSLQNSERGFNSFCPCQFMSSVSVVITVWIAICLVVFGDGDTKNHQ